MCTIAHITSRCKLAIVYISIRIHIVSIWIVTQGIFVILCLSKSFLPGAENAPSSNVHWCSLFWSPTPPSSIGGTIWPMVHPGRSPNPRAMRTFEMKKKQGIYIILYNVLKCIETLPPNHLPLVPTVMLWHQTMKRDASHHESTNIYATMRWYMIWY